MGFGGQWGYYTDFETAPSGTTNGLLLLTHRYYDPATGRFVNRDPIGYDGGINLYTFAGGNPVNETDPSGFGPGDYDPSEIIRTVGGKESLLLAPAVSAGARLTPSLTAIKGGFIVAGVEAGYEMLTYKVGHPSGLFTWIGQQAADYFYPLDTGNTDPAPVAQGATRNSNRMKADPRAGSAPNTGSGIRDYSLREQRLHEDRWSTVRYCSYEHYKYGVTISLPPEFVSQKSRLNGGGSKGV